MSSEVARYDGGGELPAAQQPYTVPTALDEWVLVVRDVAKLAAQIHDTPFVPDGMRGNPAAVTAAILTGREMGLGPMTALQHIHIVKGKPGKSAEIMRAMVLADGHQIRDVEVTDTRVILEGRRRGEEVWTRAVFTADQARKARIELGGYPEDKLYARATTRLCRRKFADVVGGIAATVDELEDGDFSPPSGSVPALTASPEPTAATPPKRTAKRRSTPTTEPKKTAPKTDRGLPAEPPAATPPADPPPLPGEDEPLGERAEEPDPDDVAASVSRAQLDKLHAQLGELTVTEREDKLTVVGLLVNRALDTSNDLTKKEATQAIDTLARILDSDDPQRTLDAVLGELEP